MEKTAKTNKKKIQNLSTMSRKNLFIAFDMHKMQECTFRATTIIMCILFRFICCFVCVCMHLEDDVCSQHSLHTFDLHRRKKFINTDFWMENVHFPFHIFTASKHENSFCQNSSISTKKFSNYFFRALRTM
jgi:hypothetical protein